MNLKDIKKYFYHLHDIEVNQKYNENLPYSFHLDMVESQAIRFKNLIPCDEPHYTNIFIGIYGHDSIEDARLTYNDIKYKFGEEATEIIYLCTENKGRNRGERKNDAFYHQLKQNSNAVFVKLCDIIANSLFSLMSNSSMSKKYKSEYLQKVKPILYSDEFKEMFDFLDRIYEIDVK